MPKIIFRPNPTPPPFPPPGPVEPSNLLKITPYPFGPEDVCDVEIINLQEINDHKQVAFFINNPSVGGSMLLEVLSNDGSPIRTSFEAGMGFDSTEIVSYFIEVTKTDDSKYTIPLSLV